MGSSARGCGGVRLPPPPPSGPVPPNPPLPTPSSPQLRVFALSPNDFLRPGTDSCCSRTAPSLHPQSAGGSAVAGNHSPVNQAVSRGQELGLPARQGAAPPGAAERPPGPGGSAPRAGAEGRGGPEPSAPPPGAPPLLARAPSSRCATPSPGARPPRARPSSWSAPPSPRAPLLPERAPSSRRAPPSPGVRAPSPGARPPPWRAPPLPARAPAPPAGPAASPPPRALRSRDVRAAGPGTRQGAGRRVETDPGSVRAGSEPETGRRRRRRRPVLVPALAVAVSSPSSAPHPTHQPYRRQVAPPPRTCPRVRIGECPGRPRLALCCLAVRARPRFEASARRPGSKSRLGSSPEDAEGEAGDEWARAAAVPGSSGLGLISTGQ